MEIVLAESLGFCMGVKRAVDLAYRARDKAEGLPVVTLGPLIHNAQEIDRLKSDGIQVNEAEQIPDVGTVVIRAHGVAPQAYEALKTRGLRIMDGTCPYVHYSQRKAVELYEAGYRVVIVGDRKHPEIIGILGHINDDADCVKSVEGAAALPDWPRIGVLAQTTVSPQKYEAILAVLRTKAAEVKVCETICDATTENQKAVRTLADEVDLVYVIGGRHSANSVKLMETAREQGTRALLIEVPEEIQAADLAGVQRVGISAGASTPDWMIQRVVEHLRTLSTALTKDFAVAA